MYSRRAFSKQSSQYAGGACIPHMYSVESLAAKGLDTHSYRLHKPELSLQRVARLPDRVPRILETAHLFLEAQCGSFDCGRRRSRPHLVFLQ